MIFPRIKRLNFMQNFQFVVDDVEFGNMFLFLRFESSVGL